MALTLCFKLSFYINICCFITWTIIVIERFSITGSDVMPISPLGGAKFEIRPHILKAH